MPSCVDCPEKDPDAFHRKRNGFQAYCKDCQSKRAALHYQKDKKKYLKRARAQRKKMIELINSLKAGPCVDCGNSYPPWVMDFDHRPGEKKSGNVARLKDRASEEIIRKEILKCDLVCANCHRERTHSRHGSVV